MTTIVSRLYPSAETAERVRDTLRRDGFPDALMSLIAEADAKAIAEAGVDPDAARRYAAVMDDGEGSGQTLFVCRAPFSPLGAARRAMEAADSEASVEAGVANENRYVRETVDLSRHRSSVYRYHPLMMTRDDYVGSGWSGWTVSGLLGWTMAVRRRETPNTIFRSGTNRPQRFKPRPIVTKPRKSSVISGGRYMSRWFWPMPLVRSGRKRSLSIMTGHPRISERFGWEPISTR